MTYLKPLVALVATLLGLATSAIAQTTSFGLDPAKLEFTAAPGQTISGTVTVVARNDGQSLIASPRDFSLDSTGQVTFFRAGSLDRSASNWLSITPESFNVPAKGSATVTVKARVPANEKLNGAYWGAVDFAPTAKANSSAGMALNVHIALVVYVTVGQQSPKGLTANLKWDAVNGLFKFTFQNKGNTVLRPKGMLTLVNAGGVKVATIPVDDFVCLPGGQLNGAVKFPAGTRPPAGSYIAVLSFSAEGMKPVATQVSVQL